MTDKTASSPGTNESETVRGKTQVYNDPEGYTPPNPFGGDRGNSEAVTEAARESREEMAKRLFGPAVMESANTDRQLVDSLFSEEARKDREPPHSLSQRLGRSKTASVEHETLTDKVQRVTGLR